MRPGTTGQGAGLDHDEGLRQRRVVRQGDMHDRRMAGRCHRREPLRGAAGQAHGRAAARQVDDLHVAPEHAPAHARAQSLRARLLGREAAGIGRGPRRAAIGLRPFAICKDAMGEAVAEAFERALDPADVAEVGADAEDHAPRLEHRPGKWNPVSGVADAACVWSIGPEGGSRSGQPAAARPSSMACRILPIAASSPMKIASPIRKWPMLNSTKAETAASSRAVS